MTAIGETVDGTLAGFRERLEAYHAWHVPLEALPKADRLRRAMSPDAFTDLCRTRTMPLEEPRFHDGGSDLVYFAGMVITAIRTANDLSGSEKVRAEHWARRALLENLLPTTSVLAFNMGPDRNEPPPVPIEIGFSIRALKVMADERTSFPGRVFHSYPVQAEKILDKVRRSLGLVSEDRPEIGSEAFRQLDRKLHFPLAKLLGFLRAPELRHEHEFRIVFVGDGYPGLRQDGTGRTVSLAPYFAKAGGSPFETILATGDTARAVVESAGGMIGTVVPVFR